MPEYKPVPTAEGLSICERYDKAIAVIICWDSAHKLTHCTTYGRTGFDKENAAAAGEICMKAVGSDLSKK